MIARHSYWVALTALLVTITLSCAQEDDSSQTTTSDTAGPTAVDVEDDLSEPADSTTNNTDAAQADTSSRTSRKDALLSVNQTEEWAIPGLSGPAYVLRTEGNVPHIYALNREDLGRVLGFVLARDRYFMMDLQRRLGLGTISELLGEVGLATDQETRLQGIPFVADRLMQHMKPELLAYLEAVVVGINAYVDQAKAGAVPPPSEVTLAGSLVNPDDPFALMVPFTVRDLAAMSAVVMYQTNFETGDIENSVRLQAYPTAFTGEPNADLRLAGYEQDIWQDQRPIFPGTGSSPGFGTSGLPSNKPTANWSAPEGYKPAEFGMLTRLDNRMVKYQKLLRRDPVSGFGSNAWAVSGASSVNGDTLVAGDGHLQLSVPSLMYQIAMDTEVLGGGDTHQIGLFLTPIPILGAGTNGKVAWSMVNPVLDITDWYREEIQLDTKGFPVSSTFQGEQKPLSAIAEEYEIANVPALNSVGRTETWKRYTTFDGRWLMEIEGNSYATLEEVPPGAAAVNFGGTLVVPEDLDDDGVITGLSFDYGAFDSTHWADALADLGFSEDINDYREATRGLVGGGLFTAAGDDQGNVLFTSYQAVPCRTYLPKESGTYAPGANPNAVLDGTLYGAFNMPTDSTGKVDPDPGKTDPYQCVVPFDAMPQNINPPEGFVFTANNDPAHITDDGDHTNDAWYIGGPWSSVRANTIERELAAHVQNNTADQGAMSAVQGSRVSRLGEVFAPVLVEALIEAKTAAQDTDNLLEPQSRLAAIYNANASQFLAVEQRLQDWAEAGFDTPSGVETFYETPTEQERIDSVATMIFNAWLSRFINGVWGDEKANTIFPRGGRHRVAVLKRMIEGRGANNPKQLASWTADTEESVFFDDVGTEDIVERSDEVMLIALQQTLEYLTAVGDGKGSGGFGTNDMSAWLWGLRHKVRFTSLLGDFIGNEPTVSLLVNLFAISTDQLPLATNLSSDDPRKELKWFPRGGDQYSVDASNPGYSGTNFTYGSGPVMRMVMSLRNGQVSGVNVIPGGQSSLIDSDFFSDQAELWLGNKTMPMRFHLPDVVEGATHRETFTPTP
jgi:penicillin amidase